MLECIVIRASDSQFAEAERIVMQQDAPAQGQATSSDGQQIRRIVFDAKESPLELVADELKLLPGDIVWLGQRSAVTSVC